jgi:histidinol-phosphate aminotransferase
VLRDYDEHHRYPDPISRRLRQAIGGYLSVDPDQILVGNGSDELIDLLLRLFRPAPMLEGGSGAESGPNGIGQVIDCQPSFGMYAFYGVANDMQVVDIPRDVDYGVDVDAIEALCARDPEPRILFVASPNNPDGQLLPEEALRRLLALPLLVVLDEAYVEFAGGSRVGWVAERDNLIVLRTFSKWAGLAGLRVGYGVFPPVLATALLKLKSPYNVNGAAQAAALATLGGRGAGAGAGAPADRRARAPVYPPARAPGGAAPPQPGQLYHVPCARLLTGRAARLDGGAGHPPALLWPGRAGRLHPHLGGHARAE